ncbi:MAG: hypothetical protein CBD77_04585 [bacterium TMED217]|nr:MAG: hypothetical protein CBD77_04585 [bacterium TMED217]|tara:strand:- start:15925 stop:17784 length:1860 start_codon:yes stop_codon:yes gene_type:complete
MIRIIISIFLFITQFIFGRELDSVLTYTDHFDLAFRHYNSKRYKLAEFEFKEILIDRKNYSDPVSHLMLAKSQYFQNKIVECQRTCNSFLNKYPRSKYELNVRVLLSDIFINKEKYSDVLEQLIPIRDEAQDSIMQYNIDYRILSSIMIGVNSSKIEQLLFSSENIINRSILNLARSYRSLLDGNMNDMELSLSVIESDILPLQYEKLFNGLNRFVGDENNIHGVVAVILPLSGKDRFKGQTFLRGLSGMAVDYQYDLSTHFKIYDNKSNDIATLKILKSINLDRSIISILGYLSEVSNIAATSYSSPIPILLSKSNYSELPIISDNIYLLSTSSEAQAKLSAQYAVNILGFKNIAVLAPADDINKNYADNFILELNQLGIDPVVTEWYYGKPENISRQFSSIRKIAWSLLPKEDPNIEYLDMVIDSLDALFDVDVADFIDMPEDDNNYGNNKMTRRDSLKVSLNTIDAIYIPIDRSNLSFIGTQLPMYNLNTKIIGNESWIDIDILSQDIIGPHLQGLTVLSSEYPKFGVTQSSELDRVYSMGYDHGYFINSLIKLSSNSRQKFKSLLKKGDLYMGASSLIELGGPSNNENKIVRVLEYRINKMGTIGYFNGTELVKN